MTKMSEKLRTTLKQEIDMKTSRRSEYLSLADRLKRLGKSNASEKLRKIAGEEAQHIETCEKILSELREMKS